MKTSVPRARSPTQPVNHDRLPCLRIETLVRVLRSWQCSVMATVYRPVSGPIQVRLKYRPGGANYGILKDVCGDLTRPQWNAGHKCYDVARDHMSKLVANLANLSGEVVTVTLIGAAQTTCVEQCWRLKPRDTRWDCVCSCAGRNHGSGSPLPLQVNAALSVQTDYTTETYTIHPTS